MKQHITKILGPYLYQKSYARAWFTLTGQVIKECRVSFRQFFTWRYPLVSLIRALGIILTSLLRLLLGRSLKFSYSFTGEDRILESLCKSRITETGFYVDVGCNHPVFLSNTYLFYKRGWKGVCIDANKRLIDKFKLYRPNDTAVCAMVSNTKEEREFYLLTNDVLSTTEKSLLESYIKDGQSFKSIPMKPVSLTEILDTVSAPSKIDILSIDTEEHDFSVLRSLDFTRYVPQIIIVEVEDFTPDNPELNLVYNFLLSENYMMAGFILKNLYFKKKPQK